MLSPLRAIKSNNYWYSWKRENFRESNEEKKERTDTINEAKKIKSDNFTRSHREKYNIAIITCIIIIYNNVIKHSFLLQIKPLKFTHTLHN